MEENIKTILATLDDIVSKASSAFDAVNDLSELASLESLYLGKKSALSEIKKELSALEVDSKKIVGEKLNVVREVLEQKAREAKELLEAAKLAKQIEEDICDVTEVDIDGVYGHLHLVTQIRQELEDIFLGLGYEIAEGNEIESDWYNFTALNVDFDHPARTMQDSFYLDTGENGSILLRTHTSPVQVHLLERGQFPIYAICPGRVYRRDTADPRHLPVFHQIEGLVVDEGIGFADLRGTVEVSMQAIFGSETRTRLRPGYFPFTEPSAEFDITCVICKGEGCRTCGGQGWIELGGCGLVHPNVLSASNVDTDRYSGFAFGFGIDRLAIMRHNILDIRYLIENDIRFLSQF
ncbi:MAG: phenylalanine--tRNA ligase subunit alpha [Firmicutes bacterium]|jgi:phenylalanyl-tRNA synthetase alpha chain|nr:phenylalanine--tRNA ligase subunit alpha [Bacillota bacterium]